MVKILLYGNLEILAGAREVPLVSAATVRDVLRELSSLYGAEFHDALFGGDGPLERLALLVNGAPVRKGVLETALADGDSVSLMPLDTGRW